MILVTGGARSGKSRFAENLVTKGDSCLYIATSLPVDTEMKERIQKHQQQRPAHWRTLEQYRNIGQAICDLGVRYPWIIIECITLMVSNIILDMENPTNQFDYIHAQACIKKEVEGIITASKKISGELVLVTNEVGMGLVPDTSLGRHFRDIAGRTNQLLAQHSDSVYFLVSGLPLRLKGGES